MSIELEPVEIPLSKKRLVFMLLGAVGFVAIGCWFLISPPTISNPFFGHPNTIFGLGLVAVVVFGLCAIYLAAKLPDNKPGLILNAEGLIDNSSGVAAGLIRWKDIEEMIVMEIHQQKIILLQVTNPQQYIEQQTHPLKRKLMQMNLNAYGTPISITPNTLQIQFDALMELIDQYRQAFQPSVLMNDTAHE